ncbi:hypothetical protein Tco_0468954 [Tanacetum coccineum]
MVSFSLYPVHKLIEYGIRVYNIVRDMCSSTPGYFLLLSEIEGVTHKELFACTLPQQVLKHFEIYSVLIYLAWGYFHAWNSLYLDSKDIYFHSKILSKVFGHVLEECPKNISAGVTKNFKNTSQTPKGIPIGQKMGLKPKQVFQPVSKMSTATTCGKRRMIQSLLKRFVDDDGNPLVPTAIVDSDSEVEVVFDKTANLRLSTSGKDGSDKGYDKTMVDNWSVSHSMSKNDFTRQLGKDSLKDKEEVIRAIKLHAIRIHKYFEVKMNVVKEREGICLISDRHPGILKVVNEEGSPWYCLRHFINNFNDKFHNEQLKTLAYRVGSQNQVRKFTSIMDEIGQINPQARQWLQRHAFDRWTLGHDGGRRYGLVHYFDVRRPQGIHAQASGERYAPHVVAKQEALKLKGLEEWEMIANLLAIEINTWRCLNDVKSIT